VHEIMSAVGQAQLHIHAKTNIGVNFSQLALDDDVDLSAARVRVGGVEAAGADEADGHADAVLWSGVVIYAYFIQTATQFFVLGAVVGLVLGGSQALSRSFYGSMIPAEASAEFYGFYTVFSKFSAMWGPWGFAIVKQATGSSRLAILSLVFLFLAGLLLLSFVDVDKARRARESRAF